jgi:isopenicillin N synthase-like dioxygenase
MLCSEAVHGAARRIAELEEAVQRMVMEGLGVPGYHDAMRESMRHVFRMSQYTAPGGGAEGKEVRYGAHQDCSTLTVVCQHEVNGLEVQTGDGEWVHFRPSSPASLVVMAGNELRVRKRASWLILPRLCFLFAREAPG